MYIIVDAYNVLKAVFSGKWISSDQRKAFIQQMGIYARKKGHTVFLVFDGFEDDRDAGKEFPGVRVMYAEYQTADELIERLLDELKAKDVLLVSSDRQLNVKAQSLNIPSIEAMLFDELLRAFFKEGKVFASSTVGVVRTKMGNQEVDVLMHEAAQSHMPKKEYEESKRKTTKHHARAKQKLSNIEKKLVEKLKKL